MNTNEKIYRQGDILLEKIEKLPDGLKELNQNGCAVLAEGEATGHKHAIQSGKVKIFSEPQTVQATYLEVAEALVMLHHEEHAPISLEKGTYRITHQREYMPQRQSRVAFD